MVFLFLTQLKIAVLVTTLAGGSSSGNSDGIGTGALFGTPFGVAIDSNGSFALVTEISNYRVRRIDLNSGTNHVSALLLTNTFLCLKHQAFGSVSTFHYLLPIQGL